MTGPCMISSIVCKGHRLTNLHAGQRWTNSCTTKSWERAKSPLIALFGPIQPLPENTPILTTPQYPKASVLHSTAPENAAHHIPARIATPVTDACPGIPTQHTNVAYTQTPHAPRPHDNPATNHHGVSNAHRGEIEMPSPINVDKLDKLLQGYDRQKSQYLVNGFRHGFSISSSLTSTSVKAKNHFSVQQFPAITEKLIDKEVEAQRYAGLFKEIPLQDLHVSPLN